MLEAGSMTVKKQVTRVQFSWVRRDGGTRAPVLLDCLPRNLRLGKKKAYAWTKLKKGYLHVSYIENIRMEFESLNRQYGFLRNFHRRLEEMTAQRVRIQIDGRELLCYAVWRASSKDKQRKKKKK